MRLKKGTLCTHVASETSNTFSGETPCWTCPMRPAGPAQEGLRPAVFSHAWDRAGSLRTGGISHEQRLCAHSSSLVKGMICSRSENVSQSESLLWVETCDVGTSRLCTFSRFHLISTYSSL